MAAFGGETLNELKDILNFRKEVKKDNFPFRLATAGTYSVLIICALICGLTSYFGNPIVCMLENKDDPSGGTNLRDFIESTCWLHGTRVLKEDLYELPPGQTCLRKSENPEDGVISENEPEKKIEENDTLYYQWVVFMLIFSAILLKLPGWIWSWREGGLMRNFYNENYIGSSILDQDQADVTQAVQKQAAKFRKIEGKLLPKQYYITFFCCQILALILMVVNFQLTDSFLNNKFSTYGPEVVSFYKTDASKRTFNPLCNTFPTKVSCNVKYGGSSGQESNYNKACILNQNIINEKIYLLLWFWFVIMFILQAFQIFLEICFMALPLVRRFFFLQATGNFLSSNVKNYLTESSFGDVFVLYQISKNMDSSFFSDLLEHLSQPQAKAPQDVENAPLLGQNAEDMEMRQRNINQVV